MLYLIFVILVYIQMSTDVYLSQLCNTGLHSEVNRSILLMFTLKDRYLAIENTKTNLETYTTVPFSPLFFNFENIFNLRMTV